MIETIFFLLAFFLFFAAVAVYLKRAMYGDIGISPLKIFLVASVVFLFAVYLYADLSLPTFILLLVMVTSAHRIVHSLLFGDLEWGYLLLFLVAAALLILFSVQEISGVVRAYLYTNSTNTTSLQ